MRIGSWHVKGTPMTDRHYGPMAQEWFSAFGNDGIGTIGNDTTLASADVDGVLCIAVQALEKRTADLREKTMEIVELRRELSSYKAEKSMEISELREQISVMQEKLHIMQEVVTTLRTQHKQSEQPGFVMVNAVEPVK
jgi:hypothetical protein